jgi:hypothetical protein
MKVAKQINTPVDTQSNEKYTVSYCGGRIVATYSYTEEAKELDKNGNWVDLNPSSQYYGHSHQTYQKIK